ncbi:MAG: glycosyltransferase [Candidatus Thalassarchaeaceae archaeon]|nr:glycosyltransferase [Candidatus Thalassarchaeaceae archaeon]
MPQVAMIVSNHCDPDPRVEKEAIALVDAGYEVTIHAFDREENKDKLSKVEGVQIKRYRVGLTPSGAPSLITGAKVLVGLRKFRKKVLRNLLESLPDIIHCHDADTLAVGLSLKRKKGTTLVFDMHDLAHTWARMAKPYSIVRRLIAMGIEVRLAKRIRSCDMIITSSGAVSRTSHPGFREWVKKRAEGANVVVVENRPIDSNSNSLLPREFTIGYAGKIREKQMFHTLIKAVEKWPEENKPKLIIAGYGTADSQVDELLNSSSINVERIKEYRRNELADIISKMSVMYALYPTERGNILDGALPTKMFDAAMHGRPSIVNSGCLMSDIATAERIGIPVDPSDIDSLQTALLQIKTEKTTVNLERDWSGEAKRLTSAYENIGNGS